MKWTVGETAKQTGISVRTLHYYDEIGLLKPSEISGSGYRYYDRGDLELLQQILFYRELDFPLKEIRLLLSAPGYDKTQALEHHKELLLLKKERLEGLISLVDTTLKGDDRMSFQEFDMTPIEAAKKKYAEETANRWGDTRAYKESKKRTDAYKKEDWERISREADEIFRGFSRCVQNNLQPESEEARRLVKEWQQHISRYYYICTDEILAGLGQMYVADERFTANIDQFGKGTAVFMSQAIAAY